MVDSCGVPQEVNIIVLIALNIGDDVNVKGHDGPRYGRNEAVCIDVPAGNYGACLIRSYDEVAMTNVIVQRIGDGITSKVSYGAFDIFGTWNGSFFI